MSGCRRRWNVNSSRLNLNLFLFDFFSVGFSLIFRIRFVLRHAVSRFSSSYRREIAIGFAPACSHRRLLLAGANRTFQSPRRTALQKDRVAWRTDHRSRQRNPLKFLHNYANLPNCRARRELSSGLSPKYRAFATNYAMFALPKESNQKRLSNLPNEFARRIRQTD